jgi:hypothetical protein
MLVKATDSQATITVSEGQESAFFTSLQVISTVPAKAGELEMGGISQSPGRTAASLVWY